jgi:hypothetical protein
VSALPHPRSSAEITTEWLNAALGESGINGGATITSFEREPIGEGAGFVGEMTRFLLSYDRPDVHAPASLITKLPTADEPYRNIALLLNMYEREIRFYEEIADDVGLRTPARYYSAVDASSGSYVLVLEDLAPGRCGDQLASCSLEEARLAITEIAKLHAAWWKHPRLDTLEWMPSTNDRSLQELLATVYRQSWAAFVEKYRDQVPREIIDLGERFGADFFDLVAATGDRPPTIVHTDYRLDNMFFGLADGSPLAVIDWQLAHRSWGMFDVAYFLAGDFPPEVRRQHETALLREYHRALSVGGVTGYDWQTCLGDYRASALFLMIFLVTNQENLDFKAYGERAQTLMAEIVERYTTAILDLNAGEFLGG